MAKIATLIASLLLSTSVHARDVNSPVIKVDNEIVFVVDTSTSIEDYTLVVQREAIRNTMKSVNVIQAIQSNFNQTTAVAYLEFSLFPTVVVDWTSIKNEQDVDDFINLIPYQRAQKGSTHSGDAIRRAYDLIKYNQLESDQQTIIIFTDDTSDSTYLANQLLAQIRVDAKPTFTVMAVILPPMNSYVRPTIIEWAKQHVIMGPKATFTMFDQNKLERMIELAIEIETQ